MDELKIKLSTRFMRGIIANLISKTVSKKLGCDINVLINEIEVETRDGKIHLHANVDAEVNNDDFVNIIKSIGKE